MIVQEKYARYLIAFGVASCLLGIIVFLFSFLTITWGCSPSGYSKDFYLAYCNTKKFSSYEHAAFYWGLESESVVGMKNADVLFLGNSQAQFAFSSEATKTFFDGIKASFFLFGFGYGEQMPFAQLIIDKYRLRPKVAVVHMAPYFHPSSSEVANAAVSVEGLIQAYQKKIAQILHIHWCDIQFYRNLGACPDIGSLFRSRKDGQWIVDYYVGDRRDQISVNQDEVSVPFDEYEGYFLRMVNSLPVKKSCLILTVVPNPKFQPGFAKKIAKKHGYNLVLSSRTLFLIRDGSHLSKDYAEIWSKEFLEKAQPIIESCLKKK